MTWSAYHFLKIICTGKYNSNLLLWNCIYLYILQFSAFKSFSSFYFFLLTNKYVGMTLFLFKSVQVSL